MQRAVKSPEQSGATGPPGLWRRHVCKEDDATRETRHGGDGESPTERPRGVRKRGQKVFHDGDW
jgi:hypothetical protein